MSFQLLKEECSQIADDVAGFAQKLIQTPSLSGEEEKVAEIIVREMRKLKYDEVFTDAMGNVVGIIKGNGQGENIMLNGHMDHVDPGQLDQWDYDPYEGVIFDGYLHGRGTCDMKGAIASQVYAAYIIKKLGLSHRGDIIISCVVQEEPAECVGMAFLCDTTFIQKGIKVAFVVLGEPSNLKFVLGHKGRMELEVTTVGRTSHGSAPALGINAVYKMLPVLDKVQTLNDNLPTHRVFGKSTISLTIISCSPGRLSVIPDRCTVCLDRRFAPTETVEQILAQIETILKDIEKEDPQFRGYVRMREVDEVSYTGRKTRARKLQLPWLIEPDHPKAARAYAALGEVGQKPERAYWHFATDGSHTAVVRGIPTIGYGLGEEGLVHTPKERVSLESLVQCAIGSAAIALAISQ